MQFVLRYHGPLPGDKPNTTEEKHGIRLFLHPQLEQLCQRERAFESNIANGLHPVSLKNRRLDITVPNTWFVRVPMRDVDFIPLVTRVRDLACEIDILWLRRERPGQIFHSGGDLDNRLKSLFDGLRIPHNENELPKCGVAPASGTRCFCLLEDDALITKVTINTYQLLEPLEAGASDTDVDLLIRVLVQSTSQHGGVEAFNHA